MPGEPSQMPQEHVSCLSHVRWLICVTHLFLPFDDVRQLRVGDSGIELTFHQGGPFVVFDVAEVATLWHFDVFGEALWFTC